MKPNHLRPTRPRESATKAARPIVSSVENTLVSARRSVFGRPRALTLDQVARVLTWHDNRVTLRQLSAELGVSTSTVTALIKSRGAHYKQAPPEERAATLSAHRERCSRLKAVNFM